MEIMLSTCKQLEMPLKADKIEGPTPVLPFLGIILDTQIQGIIGCRRRHCKSCRFLAQHGMTGSFAKRGGGGGGGRKSALHWIRFWASPTMWVSIEKRAHVMIKTFIQPIVLQEGVHTIRHCA